MKIGYFDCFAGASGDMILGSFIDAGVTLETLRSELQKLKLHGYTLSAEKKEKKHISGIKFNVELDHDHHHRTMKDIRNIIEESSLSESVKKNSLAIFTRLAEAEAKIHNTSVEQVHFHEVGAVDSIIDIVGAAICVEELKIDAVFASRLPSGKGMVRCAHGMLPVPAPATLELLKGVPVFETGIEAELVTPTGAAILTTLSRGFDHFPDMIIEQTGYGLGSRDLEIPNLIRLVVGSAETRMNQDFVQLLETNIDDMNPQFYDHVMEQLFAAGALDVFMTQVIMKKNRPGVVLSIMTSPDKTESLIQILFRETTTLGIRISEVKKRKILVRKVETIHTEWGDGRIKIRSVGDGEQTAEPEYEDCKRMAAKNHVPVRRVYETLKRLGEEKLKMS